jgi:hypothetical protein
MDELLTDDLPAVRFMLLQRQTSNQIQSVFHFCHVNLKTKYQVCESVLNRCKELLMCYIF